MTSLCGQSGAPSVWHFLISIYFAVFFLAVRLFLDRFVFRTLSLLLSRKGSRDPYVKDTTLTKLVKCSESMWKFTYYATVEAYILTVTFDEPWFWDTKQYFSGWPNQELRLGIKLFYMCQCGFYINAIATLLTWETRRKDFYVMMSHHVITVILIAFSYVTRFFRIGVVVLALHDMSDVFLEAAKVFKYSEHEVGASLLFGLFAISWFTLRLVIFPFRAIKSSSFDLVEFLDLSRRYERAIYYVFNTMLLTLLEFHLYWWLLICSMIWRQLNNRGKVGEDIRSDSDEEGEER